MIDIINNLLVIGLFFSFFVKFVDFGFGGEFLKIFFSLLYF